jgi:hypothetical protein
MVSKILLGNGSINLLLNTSTTTNITIRLRILEIMESLKKFMDSHQLTRASSHNHGEELRKLIQSMVSKTHHSNGLTRNH